MRTSIIVVLLLFSSLAGAGNAEPVTYTQERKEGEERFYLYGTSAGNYIVKSWQVQLSKNWDGTGEPELTIGDAVSKAYDYLNKSHEDVGINEVTFRPGFGEDGTILWFYHVELTTLPYEFGADTYEIIVLTTGQAVLPHKPNS